MLRIAICGDLHLSEKSPRYQHTLDMVRWAQADAKARGASLWIQAGDLCEGEASPEETARLLELADGAAGLCLGNHEHVETLKPIEQHDPTIVCAWDRFRTIQEPDVRILLVPYPRRGRPPFDDLEHDGTIAGHMAAAAERIRDAVHAELEDLHGAAPLVVVGHFTVQGMTTRDTEFELHQATEVVVPLEYLRGAAATVVGHIHRAQVVSEDPLVLGAGGLVRHSFAEADDPKSYTLLTVDDGRVTYEQIPVPARGMVVAKVPWISGLIPPRGDIRYLMQAAPGHEVKVTVQISEADLPTYDPTAFECVRDVAAHFVLDKEVTRSERTRAGAERARTAETLDELLVAWLTSVDAPIDSDDYERLSAKTTQVEEAVER